MSFWTELKNRKVFRVAGAYVIVAWLLVQVADIFFPALNLPEWSVTLVAGLVIIGFPIAVLLAWAYEITPEGVVRSSDAPLAGAAPPPSGHKLNYVILGLLVLVVALLIIDRFVLDSEGFRKDVSGVDRSPNDTAIAAVIPLPESAPLASGIAAIGFDGPLIALSPNGRWLVYVGRSESGSQLYRRDLRDFEPPAAIPGTEGAIHAFFSPDGESVGFITNDKLKRASLDGQEIQTIATSSTPVRGTWVDEDTIFIIDEQGSAVRRVEIRSGTSERLIYSWSHGFSEVLGSGKYALGVRFPNSIDGDQGELELVSLEGGHSISLGIPGFDARVLATGHLLFSRHGNLQAVEFDSEALEARGKPEPILGDLALDSIFYQTQLAVSESGVLAFVPGSDSGVGRIVWMDRQGRETIITPQAMKFGIVDLSPDDSKLSVHVGDVTDYVWVLDLQRLEGRKLPGSNGFGWPVLSRTNHVVVSSLDQVSRTILQVGSLGTTANERVIELPGLRAYGSDWSPDGDTLAITEWDSGGRMGRVPLNGDAEVEWFEGHEGDWGPVFSPDGRWLAYSSIQTGRYEIWIRPADGTGTPRQLSVNGGIEPVWCPCGEVYYRRGDEIWASAVELDGDPKIGREELRFVMNDFLDTPGRSYDVSSDGEHLYYVQLAEPTINDRIHVITSWSGLFEGPAETGTVSARQ